MKLDVAYIIKYRQQMVLYGVGVRRLAEDLQERWIRHEEEPREHRALLLQVPTEGLLAELQLFLQVRQQLSEKVVADTAGYNPGSFMSSLHDLLPRLVDLREAFGLFGELLGDVSADEHGLEVHPHVLHEEPALEDLVCVLQIVQPLLDLLSERRVVAEMVRANSLLAE